MTEHSPHPYQIRIFLPNGTPDGLRIVGKSNWTGEGVVCPRALLPESKKRDEFSRTGVYVLVGPPEEGELPTIYIGQADPIRPRLEQHHSKKDFWTWVVFFSSKDGTLNKAHVQYLESRLVELAQGAKRATLDNQAVPQRPSLTEAETADAESYLADMLSIFPLVGLSAFERPKRTRQSRDWLQIQSKGISAKGSESAEGFVVKEGSQAVVQEVPSMLAYLSKAREELVTQGVLVPKGKHLVFTQDYAFSSPSAAASVVLGRSANGRTEWKDRNGRTLKELQEKAAGSSD